MDRSAPAVSVLPVKKSKAERKARRWKRRFNNLQQAVERLYTAAMWLPDREVPDQSQLWADLRDAARLNKGTKMKMLLGSGPKDWEER